MTLQDFGRSQEHGGRSDLVTVIHEVRKRWRTDEGLLDRLGIE